MFDHELAPAFSASASSPGGKVPLHINVLARLRDADQIFHLSRRITIRISSMTQAQYLNMKYFLDKSNPKYSRVQL